MFREVRPMQDPNRIAPLETFCRQIRPLGDSWAAQTNYGEHTDESHRRRVAETAGPERCPSVKWRPAASLGQGPPALPPEAGPAGSTGRPPVPTSVTLRDGAYSLTSRSVLGCPSGAVTVRTNVAVKPSRADSTW